MRRFVEDFASIDIGLLKRRGLFEPGADPVLVDTRVGPIEVTYQRAALQLTARFGQTHKPTVQRIELQATQLRLIARLR